MTETNKSTLAQSDDEKWEGNKQTEREQREASLPAHIDAMQKEMLAKYPTLLPIAYIGSMFHDCGAFEAVCEEDETKDDSTCIVHVFFHASGKGFDPKKPKASRYMGTRIGIVAAMRAMASCMARELAAIDAPGDKPAKKHVPNRLKEKALKGAIVATK